MTMWKHNCFFGFFNIMDRIITNIVLRFLRLHLFVLTFEKLKTGPRPTLFPCKSLFKSMKRQTAKMKLLPSVFNYLYNEVKIFVFAVNSRGHFSIFV